MQKPLFRILAMNLTSNLSPQQQHHTHIPSRVFDSGLPTYRTIQTLSGFARGKSAKCFVKTLGPGSTGSGRSIGACHVYLSMYARTYACIYVSICMYACMYDYVCMYVCMYARMHVCACIYVYTHLCLCICICTCAPTCTYR